MNFHSRFLDVSAQNAATTFEHIQKGIHWICESKLFIKDGIIHDTIYGFGKQYQCSNFNVAIICIGVFIRI